MNLQQYLSVKESFLQVVSSVTMPYTIYIKRSCAPLLNLYNGLKPKWVKTFQTRFQKPCPSLLHYWPHCLDCIRLVERCMYCYFISPWNEKSTYKVLSLFKLCSILRSSANLKLNFKQKSRDWLEWTDVLQKQSHKLLRTENTEFLPVLENELLKLPWLPVVMMVELPLRQHVPHISSVPSCNWYNEKSAICSPLIPNHLFPFARLMAHWSGPGLRTDQTKILSLRFCNYVLQASHYCFAHIMWRTGSITMQKSLRQQRKIDAMDKLHKWRRWSPV